AGEQVVAVASRTRESLERAARYIPKALLTSDAAAAASLGDVVLITTGDDAIEPVASAIAAAGALREGAIVVHMNGTFGLEVLAEAAAQGARVAAIHPMQSFADVEGAIAAMPGTAFGVTAGDEATRDWARDLVQRLGGWPVDLPEGDRALYHAAAVFACNLFLAVERIAQDLLADMGIGEEEALRALLPLVAGTLDNMKRLGTRGALTGPISRGDSGVVRRHLEALADYSQDVMKAYASLSLVALGMAEGLPEATVRELESMLREALQGGVI
ncbi:MAG: Rossmann-like and DUF2520 domain-containing protein, partial [Candidatus Geothermincolia bacterium]